jgi:hypothetical protein
MIPRIWLQLARMNIAVNQLTADGSGELHDPFRSHA